MSHNASDSAGLLQTLCALQIYLLTYNARNGERRSSKQWPDIGTLVALIGFNGRKSSVSGGGLCLRWICFISSCPLSAAAVGLHHYHSIIIVWEYIFTFFLIQKTWLFRFVKWHFKKKRNPKISSFRTMTLLTFCYMEISITALKQLDIPTTLCKNVDYLGWSKKSKPLYFTHNFVKYWPIFKIISLLHSPGNLQ